MTSRLYPLSLLVMLMCMSCAHKIKVNEAQSATMSPAAAATLLHLKSVDFPPLFTRTSSVAARLRKQLAAHDKLLEDSLIARFHPIIDSVLINQVPVVIITPRQVLPGNERAIALNIHGGAFIMGGARDRSAILMAEQLGMPVYSIAYQLSPEAKFPVALNECLAVYRSVLDSFPPEKIVFIASSAGAALLVAALLKAKQAHLPYPKAIGMFSPGLDRSKHGDSYITNNGRDILSASLMELSGKAYLDDADSLPDPMVSPVYAQVSDDFPPTVINTCTRDLALSSSVRFFWKLKSARVQSELLVAEGMWHTFDASPDIPESIQARQAVADFLNGQLRK